MEKKGQHRTCVFHFSLDADRKVAAPRLSPRGEPCPGTPSARLSHRGHPRCTACLGSSPVASPVWDVFWMCATRPRIALPAVCMVSARNWGLQLTPLHGGLAFASRLPHSGCRCEPRLTSHRPSMNHNQVAVG